MKGYTIQHSIELLEKSVANGSGSGGASTAADVSYDNTTSGLVATNVQGAIDELNTNVKKGHIYSSDEHVVGKWIDGRDIYEKTVFIPAFPSSAGIGTYSVGTTNAELSFIVNAIYPTGGDVDNVRTDYEAYSDCHAGSLHVRSSITDGDVKINIVVGTNRSTLSAYITVDYVKAASEAKKNKKTSK